MIQLSERRVDPVISERRVGFPAHKHPKSASLESLTHKHPKSASLESLTHKPKDRGTPEECFTRVRYTQT